MKDMCIKLITKLACVSCSISYVAQCKKFKKRVRYETSKGREAPDTRKCRAFEEVVRMGKGKCLRRCLRDVTAGSLERKAARRVSREVSEVRANGEGI